MSIILTEIYCTYCGLSYDKENKPKAMPCSHNICLRCYMFNPKKLKCVICDKNYQTKAIKKFPINFLLFQIAEKIQNETDHSYLKESFAPKFYYECKECSIKMTRYSLHQKTFPSHSLIISRLYNNDEHIAVLKKACNDLYDNYFKSHEEFNAASLSYVNNIHELLKEHTKDCFGDVDLYTKLQMCGIINQADTERLKNFDQLNTNKTYLSLVNSSTCFNDLIKSIDDNIDNIGYSSNQVLSLWFYYYELKNTKLKKSTIEEKITKLEAMIQNDSTYLQDFYDNLLSKCSFEIKKSILHHASSSSYFLIQNRIYYYSISQSKFIVITLPFEETNSLHYEHCIAFDTTLYFMSNQFPSFSYSIDSGTILKISKFKFIKRNYSLISCIGKLFAIGKNSTEALDLENITKNEWKALSSMDFNFKPDLIVYDNYEIYAFDSISVLHKYDVFKDKWTTFPLKESTLLSLNMKNVVNYTILNQEGEIIIVGGFNSYLNQPNDNIISIDYENKKIKLCEKYQFVHSKEGINGIITNDESIYVITYEDEMLKVYENNSRVLGYTLILSNHINDII